MPSQLCKQKIMQLTTYNDDVTDTRCTSKNGHGFDGYLFQVHNSTIVSCAVRKLMKSRTLQADLLMRATSPSTPNIWYGAWGRQKYKYVESKSEHLCTQTLGKN